MADQLQLRGGTTNEHSTFTGALREVTVDTDKDTLIVHDAATAGGHPLLREDGSNSALSLGTAGTPSLKFTGDTNTGIYSPGADQVAISTGGTGRLFVDASGNVGVGGSATANGAGYTTFAVDGTTAGFIEHKASGVRQAQSYATAGVFVTGSTTSIPFLFTTANTERLRITETGLVGIGTSSPAQLLDLSASTGASLQITSTTTGAVANSILGQILFYGNDGSGFGAGVKSSIKVAAETVGGNSYMTFSTSGVAGNDIERLRINSSGNVGIGTTSPGKLLEIGTGGAAENSTYMVRINRGVTGEYADFSADNGFATLDGINGAGGGVRFLGDGNERARIDSSGRLLVGTSSSRSYGSGNSPFVQVERATIGGDIANIGVCNNGGNGAGPKFTLAKSRSGSNGGVTIVQNGDSLGSIEWSGADGTDIESVASRITCNVDGTPGANEIPGRLAFSTTADGASTPTERMRITNNGSILLKTTTTNSTLEGAYFNAGTAGGFHGSISNTNVAGNFALLYLNRQGSDGTLISFRQADISEGSISVSGTTVSYNGAHLSRWSQLPSGSARTEILRGSVLSNIDEMCEWGDEDNEQLNRMKVSDVEGDKNVSGVFQAWDDDDDTYTNDFYCAMTGDFIIRIAEGVTVERGDLLMSAGDGTAKPQDDDIIRSKTIAKVTSTNVSCTYADGSYCVPCVLMAC